jgi:hypothetical protein
MTKTFNCVECGGTVRPVAKPGRTTLYKHVEIPVPADLTIRTCDNCGEEYTHASEAAAHDAALEPVFREVVREKLVAALVALEPIDSMRRIERVLALSDGYLSRLKQGRGDASPQLVSTLCLLATSPRSLEMLERMWAAKPGAKPAIKAKAKSLKPARKGAAVDKRLALR